VGDILLLKAFVICKTETPSCFSCEIDILWVFPFLQNSDDINSWSLTLRVEHRLRTFASRVLRKIFAPERDEVTGEWRRLHTEEFYDLYSSPNVIRLIKSRKMRWAGHVARTGERRNAYSVLVERPEGNRGGGVIPRILNFGTRYI
jgi:hypothetical protein